MANCFWGGGQSELPRISIFLKQVFHMKYFKIFPYLLPVSIRYQGVRLFYRQLRPVLPKPQRATCHQQLQQTINGANSEVVVHNVITAATVHTVVFSKRVRQGRSPLLPLPKLTSPPIPSLLAPLWSPVRISRLSSRHWTNVPVSPIVHVER